MISPLDQAPNDFLEEAVHCHPQCDDGQEFATIAGGETQYGVARTDDDRPNIGLEIELDKSSLDFLSEGKIIGIEREQTSREEIKLIEYSFLQCELEPEVQTIVSNEDADGGQPQKSPKTPHFRVKKDIIIRNRVKTAKLSRPFMQQHSTMPEPVLKRKNSSIPMFSRVNLHKDTDANGGIGGNYYTIA